MARTKQEVRNWLDSQVGRTPICKNNRPLDGQCVTFIKALLEFLGAPDPWKSRGNAKDVTYNYVRDGVANDCDGWLRICSTPHLSAPYGHVWVDLKNETNYECNGQKALVVTKGTRAISQAVKIVSLDKYIRNEATSSDLPAGVIPQNGTYHIQVNGVRVREAPSTSAPIVQHNGGDLVYNNGESLKYQGYIDANGYRWVVYKGRDSGLYRFIARRSLDNKEVFGYCD